MATRRRHALRQWRANFHARRARRTARHAVHRSYPLGSLPSLLGGRAAHSQVQPSAAQPSPVSAPRRHTDTREERPSNGHAEGYGEACRGAETHGRSSWLLEVRPAEVQSLVLCLLALRAWHRIACALGRFRLSICRRTTRRALTQWRRHVDGAEQAAGRSSALAWASNGMRCRIVHQRRRQAWFSWHTYRIYSATALRLLTRARVAGLHLLPDNPDPGPNPNRNPNPNPDLNRHLCVAGAQRPSPSPSPTPSPSPSPSPSPAPTPSP